MIAMFSFNLCKKVTQKKNHNKNFRKNGKNRKKKLLYFFSWVFLQIFVQNCTNCLQLKRDKGNLNFLKNKKTNKHFL
jgi:hypothetical protein